MLLVRTHPRMAWLQCPINSWNGYSRLYHSYSGRAIDLPKEIWSFPAPSKIPERLCRRWRSSWRPTAGGGMGVVLDMMGIILWEYHEFMVVLCWFYAGFMVVLWWFYDDSMVILWWFYGIQRFHGNVSWPEVYRLWMSVAPLMVSLQIRCLTIA